MTDIYHQLATEKGFHDDNERDTDGHYTPRQMLMWTALISSELDEYRLEIDKDADPVYYVTDKHGNQKPEGWLIKLADAWIRCQDVIGCFPNHRTGTNEDDEAVAEKLTPHRSHSGICEAARDGDERRFARLVELEALRIRLFAEFELSDFLELETTFEEAVAIKHEYNKTRERKHGRKA